MYRIAIVIGLVSCDVAFRVDHIEIDAPPDVDAPSRACPAGRPFAAGTPVPLVGDHSVEGARFNSDQTLAYLSLCPANGDKLGGDLYQSSWSETTQMFGQFANLAISTPGVYDSYPTLTPDTQHLLFGSRRSGQTQIYVATLDNGAFTSPRTTARRPVTTTCFARPADRPRTARSRS
ncbi:hypothetical protein BH11MYX1_BH11MYX1_49540 [soil metagenome]